MTLNLIFSSDRRKVDLQLTLGHVIKSLLGYIFQSDTCAGMGLSAPRFETFPGDMLNLSGDLAFALARGERGDPCRRFTGLTGDLYFLPGVSATPLGVHKPLANSLLVKSWLFNKVLLIWGVCGTAEPSAMLVLSRRAAISLENSSSERLSFSLVGVQHCSMVSSRDSLMLMVWRSVWGEEGGRTGV